MALFELDQRKRYDQTTCLYVPAQQLTGRSRYSFIDLVDVMRILRSEDGDPWDASQTHASLRKHLIE